MTRIGAPAQAVARLRAICLAMPEAVEKETWQAPTFRIRDKIFAMVHHAESRPGVWCKAPPGVQAVLVEAVPARFFRPPYVGQKGWIGVWLDGPIEWDELAEILARSYRMTAPKRLVSKSADTSVAPSRRKSPLSRQQSNRKRGASAR